MRRGLENMNRVNNEDERRASPRIPVNLRCWLASESMTLLAFTLNLSEGGALITAPLKLPKDRVVDIAFLLEDTEIAMKGQIVWSSSSLTRGGAELGLEFLSTDRALADYLQLRAAPR
jgi:hypothetical protein